MCDSLLSFILYTFRRSVGAQWGLAEQKWGSLRSDAGDDRIGARMTHCIADAAVAASSVCSMGED